MAAAEALLKRIRSSSLVDAIGLLLLWVRSTNRDVKILNPFVASRVAAS